MMNMNWKKTCEHKISPLIVIVILSVLLSGMSNAQSISGVGTTAAPFLKIGVGARALGMGEAYTTQAEDITALYWNSAGLANLNRVQILLNHFDYLFDMYYDFGGIAVPIQSIGTFGFFVQYLGMPDLERTTVESPEGNGEKVSASSLAAGVCYARALTDRFAIGGGVKYVKESIWNCQSSVVAFDVGLQYRTFFKNLKIGMAISNFGGDLQMQGRDLQVQHDISELYAGNSENNNAHMDTDEFPLPIIFRVGLSANLAKDFLGLSQYDWIVAIDAIHPNDDNESINIGTEIKVWDLFALRTGYRHLYLEDREGGFTFGFGLHANVMNYDLDFDYANVDYGRLDKHNKFSLIFTF
jgi:hypothetical protein